MDRPGSKNLGRSDPDPDFGSTGTHLWTRLTPGKGLRVFHKDTLVIQTVREENGLYRIVMAPQAEAHAKAAQVDKAS
jgi:hypothetical protein